MRRTVLPKIKEVWNRFRWQIIVGTFILVVILVFTFLPGDKDIHKGLAKWMIEKKAETLDRQLSHFEESDMKNDKKIVEVEEKIKDVKKTYKEIDKDVDGRSVSELSEAFKRLGY